MQPDSGSNAALRMAKAAAIETLETPEVRSTPDSQREERRKAKHESLCKRLRLKLPVTSSVIYPPCHTCADYERNNECRIQQPDAAHSLAWVIANAIMLAEALGE
ncbi:hypothetical protein [Paraburkholderia sp. C35]|uniref:hypothetical protein n=1 Tax=Paraburkholderia sp. C35 TaxID=2126993 RepID=UPI001EF41C65|nr:hypothetical protein [Paraburkholderia sp. C35]